MCAAYTQKKMKITKVKKHSTTFMSVDEIQMPKTKDLDSWRAYIEDGERKFCEHEVAILKRFVRRITGVHKKLLFPNRFKQDRATTIGLWNQYVEARQTPAEAAQRSSSISENSVKVAAATLQAAREKLIDTINANPQMVENVLQRREAKETMKGFKFSSGRVPRGRGRRDRPLRARMGTIRHQANTTKPHAAPSIEVEKSPVVPQFSFNFAIPKPAVFLLRKDPIIRKHMVKQGRESPLRQSVSLHQIEDTEEDLQELEVQPRWSVENLKLEIAALERRNFPDRTRHPLPLARRPRRSRLNGL